MIQAYGFANRCLSEVTANMLNNEELCKFLYYTQGGENKKKKKKETPRANKIIDKNIYTGRRVPDILHRTGAYVCTRVQSYAPLRRNSEVMKVVEIEVMVIVHDNCAKTLYGTRDVCIITAIEEALDEQKISGVGKCVVTGVTDINGLPVEYSGYYLFVEVQGFPTLQVRR